MISKKLTVTKEEGEELISGLLGRKVTHRSTLSEEDYSQLAKLLKKLELKIEKKQIIGFWDRFRQESAYRVENPSTVHVKLAACYLTQHYNPFKKGHIVNLDNEIDYWDVFRKFVADKAVMGSTETYPSEDFQVTTVRRNVIASICDIQNTSPKTRIIVVSGMPGSGKSTILKILRSEFESEYGKDAVIGITFTDKVKSQHFADSFFKQFQLTRSSGERNSFDQIEQYCSVNRVCILLDQFEWLQLCEEDFDPAKAFAASYGEIINEYYEIKQFIQWFSVSGNGVLIIGTRYFIPSLKSLLSTKLAIEILADKLTNNEALELIHLNNVDGTEKEIHDLVTGCGHHAYSLALACHMISQVHDGSIRSFLDVDIIKRLENVKEKGHNTAKSIILWYRDNQISETSRLILKIVAIFAYEYYILKDFLVKLIFSLKRKHADSKGKTSDEIRSECLEHILQLKNSKLLFEDDGYYWAHPITKQEFYNSLDPVEKTTLHSEIHDFLFAGYRDVTAPKTLNDLSLPIKLVIHAAGAGKYDEAYKFYLEKVAGPKQTFLTMTLGAWDINLSILRYFYVNKDLLDDVSLRDDTLKQRLINNTGLTLLNTGRLSLAALFFLEWAKYHVAHNLWYEASINYYHLSGIQYRSGEIRNAVSSITQSFELMNKVIAEQYAYLPIATEDAIHIQGRLAYIYFLAGQIDLAGEHFEQSETAFYNLKSHSHQSIIGIPVIKYGDYLSFNNQLEKAEEEALKKLKLCQDGKKWLGELARCKRCLGEIYRKQKKFRESNTILQESIQDSKEFGMSEIILNTLLELAILYIQWGDRTEEAKDYIQQAKQYVGELKLYLPKIYLIESIYHFDKSKTLDQRSKANEHLKLANQLSERAINLAEEMGSYWGVEKAKLHIQKLKGLRIYPE